MISFEKENILNVRAEALVNSVNLKGVMGKGIALAIKNAFPENYKLYKTACSTGDINIGRLFITETNQLFPKYIINFPTKDHWKYPSKYEYIEKGMIDLVEWINKNEIKSIAIPPLGSGNGKLDWQKVKKIILRNLEKINYELNVIIIEPSSKFESVATKRSNDVKLTPARVMLIYLMNKYKILGYEVNFLVAQKLTYFLQRFDEPLKLRFSKGYYGPYADNLMPVLNILNGSYINFKDKNDNKPSTVIRVNKSKIDEINIYSENVLSVDQNERLNKTLKLIKGFETPFGLELLGTIDFICSEEKRNLEVEEILDSLQKWTNRKHNLFKPHYVKTAKARLDSFFKYN